MTSERCPECLLTPQAEQVLQRLEAKLERTRPGDAGWEKKLCSTCGRLTAISDQQEGWTIGDRADERRADPNRTALHPDPGRPGVSGDVPGWVTVREAAFLSRIPEDEVLQWVAGGIVEHRALLRDRNDVASVLVRTRDLDVAISNHRG
ncbi:MAG TPA: hypothetical protein VGA93_00295 [Actinomycetota bacterium]